MSRDIFFRRRQWRPTPVLLPGESHGRRSLVGCGAWGCWESDMTEWLHFHFSPSCIGEGNGNPLQCSCLENARDGGAWWAAVYGVAQSRTGLKRLSSSSSSNFLERGLEGCTEDYQFWLFLGSKGVEWRRSLALCWDKFYNLNLYMKMHSCINVLDLTFFWFKIKECA